MESIETGSIDVVSGRAVEDTVSVEEKIAGLKSQIVTLTEERDTQDRSLRRYEDCMDVLFARSLIRHKSVTSCVGPVIRTPHKRTIDCKACLLIDSVLDSTTARVRNDSLKRLLDKHIMLQDLFTAAFGLFAWGEAHIDKSDEGYSTLRKQFIRSHLQYSKLLEEHTNEVSV